jgi:hypothetical protein
MSIQQNRTATSENIESTLVRGRALWDSIYTPHADKLHDKLGSYHPDFICEFLLVFQRFDAFFPFLDGSSGQTLSIL